MVKKITNEVLAEKIDSMHATLNEIKGENKLNTEFRLQAKGIIGAISFASVLLGAGILSLIQKIWK